MFGIMFVKGKDPLFMFLDLLNIILVYCSLKLGAWAYFTYMIIWDS